MDFSKVSTRHVRLSFEIAFLRFPTRVTYLLQLDRDPSVTPAYCSSSTHMYSENIEHRTSFVYVMPSQGHRMPHTFTHLYLPGYKTFSSKQVMAYTNHQMS